MCVFLLVYTFYVKGNKLRAKFFNANIVIKCQSMRHREKEEKQSTIYALRDLNGHLILCSTLTFPLRYF